MQVFDADGQFVNSFGGERFWRHLSCISTVGGGQIIILGKSYYCTKNEIYLLDGQRNRSYRCWNFTENVCCEDAVVAFPLPTNHVIIATLSSANVILIEVYTKEASVVRSSRLNTAELNSIQGMTVSAEGRIAILCTTKATRCESGKHVVYIV